jgi:hypothetical protein
LAPEKSTAPQAAWLGFGRAEALKPEILIDPDCLKGENPITMGFSLNAEIQMILHDDLVTIVLYSKFSEMSIVGPPPRKGWRFFCPKTIDTSQQ